MSNFVQRKKVLLERAKYDISNIIFLQNDINYELFDMLKNELLYLEFIDNNIHYTIPYFEYLTNYINCLFYDTIFDDRTSLFNPTKNKIMSKKDIIQKDKSKYISVQKDIDTYNKRIKDAKYDITTVKVSINNKNYNILNDIMNSLLSLEIIDKNFRYSIDYFKYLMCYFNCLLYEDIYGYISPSFIPNNIKIMTTVEISRKHAKIEKLLPSYEELYDEEENSEENQDE